MKISFLSIIILCSILSMILASCESHEQKLDDVFERVKKEKGISNDTIIITNAVVEEPVKQNIPKIEAQNEWLKFKSEIEKRIVANERIIKALKEMPDPNAKLIRRITTLEKDNDDFRRQMDQYYEEVKVKWENFKIKLGHDVNEISIELKDLTVTNK